MKQIIYDDIKDYYYADENGNIYSKYSGNFRLLSYDLDKDGYYRVSLQTKNGRKSYRVNKLIAILFLPNPNNYKIVHHKDNNKKNNKISNLEWTTPRENTVMGYKNNNYHFTKKIKAILPSNEIIIFNSIKECSNYFNVSYYDISKIANKKITPRKKRKNSKYKFSICIKCID